jgi:hypothetical protein
MIERLVLPETSAGPAQPLIQFITSRKGLNGAINTWTWLGITTNE